MPATRVDDVVIFDDGTSRALTEDELRRLNAGEDVRLDPRSGQRTPLVGESDNCWPSATQPLPPRDACSRCWEADCGGDCGYPQRD